MKIIGVGLNKTGTKTLGACIRHWDISLASFSPDAFRLWLDNDHAALMGWIDRYDGFEDWPWPLVYREIDRNFPESKFIMTRRIKPEVWFESLCRHAERTGPSIYRKAVYGFEMPHGHRYEHTCFYENHLQSVRDYFEGRPGSLLEVCWEEGDGWERLSQFLGLPRPSIPFPHENKFSI